MLNDKAMVKIVKQGNKKGKRLFIYNVDGIYYFSDTYGIYKFIPELHQKTGQEISKIFMGLPEEGKTFSMIDKERTDSTPDIMNIFFDAEKASYDHKLKATDYIKEVKSREGKVTMTARILVNNEFVTLVNDDYFSVTKEHHTLKNNSRNSLIAVFNEDELLAIIMPIKSEKPEKIDKFIEIAA
jgi:hypothetical protein